MTDKNYIRRQTKTAESKINFAGKQKTAENVANFTGKHPPYFWWLLAAENHSISCCVYSLP
jgi:hypothetical protein